MITSTHYLFSKNNKIGSKAISWGTAYLEPTVANTPSHVAILINEKWVFESTLETGVRIIRYRDWLKINTEVYRVKCQKDWTMEELKPILKSIKNKKYDYLGIAYFTYRIILNVLFKCKIPSTNLFNHKDKYFCCEVISEMTGVSYEMKSPVQLMVELNKVI